MKIGIGNHVDATHMGDYKGTVVQRDGPRKDILLQDVLIFPDMYCDLVSMTQMIEKGSLVEGKNGKILILCENKSIIFDRKLGAVTESCSG